VFRERFALSKSQPRGRGTSQRTRIRHAARAPSLATDVAQDSRSGPERQLPRRDGHRREGQKALHGRSAPFLLARTIATPRLPGRPSALPLTRAADGIADAPERLTERASAARPVTLRATIVDRISLLRIALRPVALLYQQLQFGLTRDVFHAAARVPVAIWRASSTPREVFPRERSASSVLYGDAGRGAVPLDQTVAALYPAVPPTQPGEPNGCVGRADEDSTVWVAE